VWQITLGGQGKYNTEHGAAVTKNDTEHISNENEPFESFAT
jgi:hypothetical protein